MPLLTDQLFVCFDCETTGLDPLNDRVIEVAIASFTFKEIKDRFESLVDPEKPISEESLAIHHISSDLLVGKPTIDKILPDILKFFDKKPIIVGHGIDFDIQLIANASRRFQVPCTIESLPAIDTLRLARHYGDSPNNSLESLAEHFNIPSVGAHRAMNDVEMNVEVFKSLVRNYRTTDEIFGVLSKPIKMKFMPLGKHKGRPFAEIPLHYLFRAAQMDFDQDLLFSIRSELKRRKQGKGFFQSVNPFTEL